MTVFQSQIEVQSSVFQDRFRKMESKVKTLQNHLEEVRQWGLNFSHKQIEKNKKLPVRVRIQKLLDSSSHFLELSPLAGYKMYPFKAPSGGLITGIGLVAGRECVIIANDPAVKGGAYLPITVKKHLRAQEIAMQNRLPCFYLVDSGGAYLPLQAEIFPDKDHFGAFFYNQSQMQSMGLEQISIVFGQCTAGGAYIPALSDKTIMVEGQSAIFLGGPPLVFSATGEKVSAEELGGTRLHSEESGTADYTAETEESAIEKGREILFARSSMPTHFAQSKVQEPHYDPQEIYGIVPEDLREPFNMREILARIVDASSWEEFKQNYGDTLAAVQTQIGGFHVGILASQGILFGESARKAAHFIDLCDRHKMPLIFFQNVMGFMVGKKYESQGIAKDGAKMVSAVSLSRVPRFTVIVGGSYGAGNYGMCGRAYRPRQLWMWPSARIGVMGGETARHILSSIGKKISSEDQNKLMEQYDAESTAYYSTARIWDDGLIDPLDTRKFLTLGIQTAMNAPLAARRKGVYRM